MKYVSLHQKKIWIGPNLPKILYQINLGIIFSYVYITVSQYGEYFQSSLLIDSLYTLNCGGRNYVNK